ncbi:histone-lysine N-methyltransferase ATX3-like [Trifolium medium]|uniref:Histone-lysine N-methyltransferase ATX3-like n=1 Tax=Trifolium medium TaxID=97028 RepID=A0A392M9J0_9FABA|nr:histone-lysine N-methyltransferase ATX3-like [Trifolium medium]
MESLSQKSIPHRGTFLCPADGRQGLEGCSGIQKKRMVNEFYSIGDADDFSSGYASWSSEVSHCDDGGGGEVEFNSNSVLLNGKTVNELGSMMARLQMLPSRFTMGR